MSFINSINRPQASLGRTGQDLSSTHAFSMRPAVLRPVIVQDCVPDSAFRINVTDLVRTSALQTAAFLRGKHELDFFFVPYNMVYGYFNDIVLERGDAKSPIFGVEESELPTIPLEHLYYSAAIPYIFMRYALWLSSHVIGHETLTFKSALIDSLGSYIDLSDSTGIAGNFLALMLYNELEYVPNDVSRMSFVGYDALALLDTLGYGNFGSTVVSLCDSQLSQIPLPLVDDDLPRFWGALEDALQYAIMLFFNNGNFNPQSISTSVKRVNPLRLYAYQKVFYDRYRDDVFDNTPVYRYAFSAEGANFATLVYYPFVLSSPLDRYPLATFLRSRTRMIKKDLVSGVFPSSQFGGAASLTGDDTIAPQLNVDYDSQDPNVFNVRYVLAMQKYRETLLRAGSRSKDVLKALFGVESHYINDTYVKYVGSFSGTLDLNKVSCTAEGGSYSVGDLAGNVFSSLSGDTIEFTCNDYGVLIGVMSFFPQLLHNNFGLSPHVQKYLPLHFFKSQFEDLGLQPVSSSVLSLCYPDDDGAPVSLERTIGFSARYNEYKQNLDFVHDQFSRHNLPFYCPSIGANPVLVNNNDGYNSNYVTVRGLEEDISLSSVRNYLLPDCMDSIFASLDTGDISNYHFDIILDCQINAVLPMSNLGLPY